MNNTITSPFYSLTTDATEHIDLFLPFEGRSVMIWSIDHKMTGYGNWDLFLDVEIDNKRHKLKAHTTHSIMIDYWDGKEHESDGPQWMDNDYQGKISAIELVFRMNEHRLAELVQSTKSL